MNLDAIKSKLSALNNTGGEREKIDYEAIFWKPSIGKHQVRVLPSKYNPEFPFSELKFHYKLAKFPMMALSNFGKQDPVEDFVKELRKTSDKENWSLSGKIEPRARIFAPIIVRGEEAKGVRLWGFGVNIYKALLALAEDEDIGDFTDPINGYDMIVEQTPGTPYAQTTIRVKPKMVPLAANAADAEKWLSEQPNPLESFTQYDYEFIKNKLQAFLAPGSEEEVPTAHPGEAESKEVPKAKPQFEMETATEAPSAKKVVTSFDDLFS